MTIQPPDGHRMHSPSGPAAPGGAPPPLPAEPSHAEPPGAACSQRPPGRRDWRVAVLAVAVVLLVVAGVVVYAQRGAAPVHVTNARLERALVATNASGTADVTMTMQATMDGIAFHVTGNGSVDFATRAASLDVNVLGHTLAVVEAGGVAYADVGSLLGDPVPGKPWARVPLSQLAGAGTGTTQLFATGDPATAMAALLQLGASVTPVGTSTIDGSPDQGYRIDLTLAALQAHASQLPPSIRSLLATAGSGPRTGALSATMYVDPAGQLQAAHVLVTAQGTGHLVRASIDLAMSHFGSASVPGPPPATQTFTYRQLHGSSGAGSLPFSLPGGTQAA